MVISVFLNIIYLLFPLMCYFLYLVYSKVRFEEEKFLFLDLAIFSSYYICSRFGGIPAMFAFLINIPLLLALYKKRMVPSLVLSFCIAVFLSEIYNVSTYFLVFEYMVIFIFSFFTTYKTINIFLVFKILFGIISLFLIPGYVVGFSKLIYVIVLLIIMYVVFYFIILFYIRVESIVNMYYSLDVITKEKKLYESLFKITHEIKNPLAVCKGYLDMFDIKNPKKANKYVNIINQEIDRTLMLLKDFSDVSKINIEKNVMDITMLLEDVYDEVLLAFNTNVRLKTDFNGNEVLVDGDYNRLKQVLINLVKNAKESIKDSGTVILEGRAINKNYVISVRDNGIGMDNETIKKIGTAFYTTKKNGTGLGVCLSREIIERHGGTITYFSKEKKGTTVRITIPISNKASG